MFMPPLPPAMPPLPPGGPQGVLSFWSSMLLSSWACMNRLFSSCLFLIPSSCFFILSIIIISSSVLLFCSASNIWPMLASLCSHMALVCSLWDSLCSSCLFRVSVSCSYLAYSIWAISLSSSSFISLCSQREQTKAMWEQREANMGQMFEAEQKRRTEEEMMMMDRMKKQEDGMRKRQEEMMMMDRMKKQEDDGMR